MDTPTTPAGIVRGDHPLERQVNLMLGAKEVNDKKRQVMREEMSKVKLPAGFRPGAKVLPPAYRKQLEPHCQNRALTELATLKMGEVVKEAGLNIFPDMWIIKTELAGTGESHNLTCAFEVVPEVPEPDFEGVSLRLVEQVVRPEAIEPVLAKIRRSLADWQKVDRGARIGDRINLREKGKAEGAREEIIDLGDEGYQLSVRKRFEGKVAGDEVILAHPPQHEGAEPLRTLMEITSVEWPKLPDEDLAFARRLDPEVGSMEGFRANLMERVAARYRKIAEQINVTRGITLIQSSTRKFDLPARTIEGRVGKVIANMRERAKEDGHQLDESQVNELQVKAQIEKDMRSTLIYKSFVDRNGVKIVPEDLQAELESLAEDEDDPKAFMRKAVGDKDTMGAVGRHCMARKVLEVLAGKVDVERIQTDHSTIDMYVSRGDPEVRPMGLGNTDADYAGAVK